MVRRIPCGKARRVPDGRYIGPQAICRAAPMKDFREAALKLIFRRYMRRRLASMMAPEYPVILEYPIDSRPRYGFGEPAHERLSHMIDDGRRDYRSLLGELCSLTPALARIAAEGAPLDASQPTFLNHFFLGLDAVALYGVLATRNPGLLLEIGSGNSTKFARRAIRDHALRTCIISCDPAPRASVDELCDEVIRKPIEAVDPAIVDRLGPGDVLFIDSSHRVFMNSDVVFIFLQILPRLRPGVLVHFHDILLPYDYPPGWIQRHYSEQYMLASWLLGGGAHLRTMLPNAYISKDNELSALLEPLWRDDGLRQALGYAESIMSGFIGFSYWMECT